MEVTRIFDILERYKQKFDKSDALGGKKDGIWETYSVDEYVKYSNKVSYGLLALGIKKGDKIATISNNRPEWNFVDMGLLQIGAVHVPIYPTISNEETEYILNHCDAKMIIVSDKSLFEKLKPIVEKINVIKNFYTFNEVEGATNWKQITDLGEENEEKYKGELAKIKESVAKDDLATLIYTSGTTGMPKGVVLTHNNLVTNFIETSYAHPLGYEHRALSFLPLCHIYERMLTYHFQYKGISIYYAESMGKITENLKEIQPHIFSIGKGL
jgi:long-chain acyl-CoA synthetase